MFTRYGVDVELLPPLQRQERLARLSNGEVDLALIDLASFVDLVATKKSVGARCVFVLTQRLPMAALHVRGRPVDGRPIASPHDLLRARYGAPTSSNFVAEHRALLRRLGGDDPRLHVELPYSAVFAALANGGVDVVPDFAGTLPRYERALEEGPARPAPEARPELGALRYRECGVRAYGIGFVASAAAMRWRAREIEAFLAAARQAYGRMQVNPASVIGAASKVLPSLDQAYALREWETEEQGVIFGYEAAEQGVGASTPEVWRDTVAWRREVARLPFSPEPEALFLALSTSLTRPSAQDTHEPQNQRDAYSKQDRQDHGSRGHDASR